ncbi:MAG TPA: hypothetical protein VK716_00290 [Terracidiphilus sp.]|nr:hypothetical protein [Terracidiphilus sp.]
MKVKRTLAAWICLIAGIGTAALAQGPWDQPASSLADQVAAILGPGQAKLSLRNASTISGETLPAIRRQLEQDLKTHGILLGGVESANQINVTLSESSRERLWVAEVVQGNETHVTMVHLAPGIQPHSPPKSGLMLRSQTIFTSHDPLLAVLETPGGIITLQTEQIVVFAHIPVGWSETKRIPLNLKHPESRDPHGELVVPPNAAGFQAWLGGIECNGVEPESASDSSIQCRESDDPWPLIQAGTAIGAPVLGAFYNPNRNYFTGILTPALNVELPPFYAAAMIPRPVGGSALLVGGVDGKVRMLDNGALRNVSGTRDWGSDFAAVHSGCGNGSQIVASGSGEAATDSLRAYELPALEAVPASSPLAMNGTVTALWTAPDGKSALAIVHTSTEGQYEVDRVTALCD